MRTPSLASAARSILTELKTYADPGRARQAARYFHTGKGQYGEGDQFLGVAVPVQRGIAKRYASDAKREDVIELLASDIHEARLTGIFLLVHLFDVAHKKGGGKIWVDLYLSQTGRMNNWDLVDSGAYKILGTWLLQNDRSILDRLASSDSLWENRIAIVATLAFIRRGDVRDTLHLAERLLSHPHHLIHKATGWMLREAWQRDPLKVEQFLHRYHGRMPRIMLRYAIEKMRPALRKSYLLKD